MLFLVWMTCTFSFDLGSMHLKQLHLFRKVLFGKSHIRDPVNSLCFISEHFMASESLFTDLGVLYFSLFFGPNGKFFLPLWIWIEEKKKNYNANTTARKIQILILLINKKNFVNDNFESKITKIYLKIMKQKY